MILDRLVEKKDLFIYIDQRILRLSLAGQKLGEMLRDPEVSNKQKKGLMRGQMKLHGRNRELRYLKRILGGGKLRSISKEMWKLNFEDGLIGCE